MNKVDNEQNACRKDAELSPFQVSLIEYDEMRMSQFPQGKLIALFGEILLLTTTRIFGNLMLDKEAKR